MISARKTMIAAYDSSVETKVQRFAGFTEAEKADRDFYKKLTGNERIQLCLELSALDPAQPLERVWCIRKFSESPDRDL